MSFKFFVIALLYFPIIAQTLPFEPIPASGSAALMDRMSDLDREMQLRREDPPISLTERDFIFRFLQSPTFSPAVLSTETAHRLARLSLQPNEEATDILDAQSLQQLVYTIKSSLHCAYTHHFLYRESLVRFQLPRIGPRDYGPRGIVATSREPASAPIGSPSENQGLFESSILLSDLLSRLEGETPLGLGLGISYGRTTPPSPSVYDGDLGETETFLRGSSSSSTQDYRAPSPSARIPGRTLSQSYRQLVDDFPADECLNSDYPQILERIARRRQSNLLTCERTIQANSSSDQASDREKSIRRNSTANRAESRHKLRFFSFILSPRQSSKSQSRHTRLKAKLKARLSRIFRHFGSSQS